MTTLSEVSRRNRYRSRYGIEVEHYDEMLRQQGGVCALCGKPPSGRRLCVDHDHVTGKVRGLLCVNCNTSLGKLGLDQPHRIARVVGYLGR